MSKDSTAVFKKSVSLEAPSRRKSSTVNAEPFGSPDPGYPHAAAALPAGHAQTMKTALPLADVPWSEYVSRGACDMLSSSLNVAFNAVDSHDLRAAMATAATLTRDKVPRSPLRDSTSTFKGSATTLPRIATALGAAPPRMEMSDFTLAYALPQVPAWKMGFTPRFAPAASHHQLSVHPRDLTERAMEVDLRLPSPSSASVSLLSPFTACANERAARMQTALDRNHGPTKWEAVAAAGGAEEEEASPNEDADEASDWAYLLSLAQSRREQATQKLKEMDEQLQDFQLEQQQQQRRSRSLRTPAHELISSESKKKADAAASGNAHDAFAASLLPEDMHTGLPVFFMKSSEIYARIRAIRANPSRREEQRALAEEIMKRRKGMNSPPRTKDGSLDPLTRNKLHATWSKDRWIAHIKEAAEKERAHISEVILAKKQKEEGYKAELQNMISRKEVRRRKLAEDEERAKRRERLQKLQTKWIQVHETVRSFLLFKDIFENIEMLRQRDWRQNQAALTITKFFALITFLSRSQKLLQVKRILRRSMWIPLMNIRIHRKKKSCHLIARLFDVMHARRYGVYAVMLYRARILKVQRFLQRCIASFKAQVAMNVVAAAAFVDVSDRVQDIIKRRVQKKGAGSKSKEHAKGQKDSKKAVSLSHLQSTIADTMSNEAFQQCICKAVREQVSRLRVEHFRRFRDYLRAMKRSAFKGVGSGNMLESEAQQKVMVRIRRAVLEELSSRQYATLARAMKVSTLPLDLFTRPLPITLPHQALKARPITARSIRFKDLTYMQECIATATQALLASMPNARTVKAHEVFYGHVILSGSAIVYSWMEGSARNDDQ